MPLFRKGRPSTAPQPVRSSLAFVPAPPLAPTVPAVTEAVGRRDWDAGRAQVLATDPRVRESALRVLADAAPYEWAAEQATDAFGHTVAAAVAVMNGWRARTAAQSENVTQGQFETLWHWLERADQHLAHALAGDSSDPTPAVYSLITARGRQKPLAEAEQAFADLKRRDPDNLEGHLQRLQYSCQKWFGSHEQMHGLASSVAATAAPGSDLHVLPLVAHVERLIAYTGEGAHTQRLAYLQAPEVAASVDRAMSQLAPGTPGHRLACNVLAHFAWIRADVGAFDAAFEQVACQVTTWPWEMYGADPVTVVKGRSFGRV